MIPDLPGIQEVWALNVYHRPRPRLLGRSPPPPVRYPTQLTTYREGRDFARTPPTATGPEQAIADEKTYMSDRPVVAS